MYELVECPWKDCIYRKLLDDERIACTNTKRKRIVSGPEGFTTEDECRGCALAGFYYQSSSGGRLPPPTAIQMAKNAAKAAVAFINDPGFVSDVAYKQRMSICNSCKYFTGQRCLHPDCGCIILAKARGKAFDCPIKKWPAV